MPGPPPKHPSVRARRNNPKAGFRSLSPDGRSGPAPAWPLQPDIHLTASLELARDRIASLQVELDGTEDGRARGRLRRQLDRQEIAATTLELQIEQSQDAELELWDELWSTPVAVMWEESHAAREVAQYVRWKIRAEQGELKAATEARMLSDRLGLNPLALLRLRTEIERVDEAEDRGRRRRPAAPPAEGSSDGGGQGGDPRGGLYAVS